MATNIGLLTLAWGPSVLLALSALYFALRARTNAAHLIAAGAILSLILGIANQYTINRSSEAFYAGGEGAIPESAMTVGWILAIAGTIPPLLMALGIVLLARAFVRR